MEILFRLPSFTTSKSQKIESLLDLPIEILSTVFKLVPNELKATCKTCYFLYNDYYAEKLVNELGNDVIYNIAMYNLPYLVDYIASFDYWRHDLRLMIAKHYQLEDYEPDIQIRRQMTPKEVVNCNYVKDSWKLVYGVFKNRRLFVEYQDYEIDEPQSYVSRNLLHINKTYLVKYKKTIKLSSDLYSLSCGIVIQNALGLGSMNFKVLKTDTQEELLSFFPPTNINDLVPHGKFVLMNLGNFYVSPKPKPKPNLNKYETPVRVDDDATQDDKLVEIDIIMEETGLYLKSGFIICFIDVNAYPQNLKIIDPTYPSKLIPLEETKWIAWSIDNQKPTPESVINILLKRLYKSINKSLFLKPLASPFQRIGSFAEVSSRRSSLISAGATGFSGVSLSSAGNKKVNSMVSSNGLQMETIEPVIPEVQGEDEMSVDDQVDETMFQTKQDDDNIDVDLKTYNKTFYSQYNENNEELTRTFRFVNIIERKKYESMIEAKKTAVKQQRSEYDEPLKWKMTTIFEV